jgi:hypothetical protein
MNTEKEIPVLKFNDQGQLSLGDSVITYKGVQDFAKEYQRVNSKLEDIFFPKVKKAIHSVTEDVIAVLRGKGIEAAKVYTGTLMTNPQLTKIIEKLYTVVGLKHARLNYSRLLHEPGKGKGIATQLEQKGFGFNALWTKIILDYLREFLIEKITFEVAKTTRDTLLKALTAATIGGLSIDQTVDSIQELPFERYQAARIVRTEVNRAANVGAKAQSETDQYQQVKEWISAEDNRVRGKNPKDHASHVALNSIKIDEEDKFRDPRNGDLLDIPGDPTASAASTINCRCAVAYTYKRDNNGNLIPKRKTTFVQFPGTVPARRTVLV